MKTRTRQPLELIDWSERYPNETNFQTGIRQSTYCLCGKPKEIGEATCGCNRPIPAKPFGM